MGVNVKVNAHFFFEIMKNLKTLLSAFGLFAALTMGAQASSGWTDNYQQALKQASQEHKRILLDFTGSDWCIWCKKIQKEIFSQTAFKEYADKNLILVEIDFPQGKTQTESTKKQNAELQAKYHVDGFPTLILLSPAGKEIKQTSGYLAGGPEGFIKWVGKGK